MAKNSGAKSSAGKNSGKKPVALERARPLVGQKRPT